MTEREPHGHADRRTGPGADTESLLGAYVLDAVDGDERRRVEQLLATDLRARLEADRLSAAADRLAAAAAEGASAPPQLWSSIAARLGERTEPAHAAPATVTPLAAARRHRGAWLLSAAAVVVLAVVGVVAAVRSGDGGGTDRAASMEQMAREAATMPGARTAALTDPGATMAVEVVVDPQGHGFVMSAALPALDDAHTYQLWSVDGTTMVSLGLLGPDPHMAMVGVDGQVHQLAITMEPAGGSAEPTTAPMASGTLEQV